MNRPTLLATGQRIAAFAASTAITLSLLMLLATQADAQHADALLAAQTSGNAQHCVLPTLPGNT